MDPDPASRYFKTIPVILSCIIFSCRQISVTTPKTDSLQSKKDSAAKAKINAFIDPDTVGKRTLYLTFDDGPNNGTPTVVNILKAERVPATFFLIGMHVKDMPVSKKMMPILRQMPNVVLCNHSFTHGYKNAFDKFYADVPGSENDFERCRDTVHFDNPIARCPGNNIWRTPKFSQTTFERYKPASNNIRDSGFVLLGWDAEWRYRSLKLVQSVDQMEKDINDLYEDKENRCSNHCVLLMHDLTFMDAADSTSLQQLIHRFKTNPLYRFDVVTNHPFVKP
ncbi:MAG: polysaccharide deacetylase family protein [Bacteroidota bacterium]